jgi:MoxR-like ATPase
MSPEPLSPAHLRDRLLGEIGKHYVGAAETVELLIIALLARGHVLLEGVPGLAKTTLARAFSETLGCAFSRIQFTPDLLPADITGTYVLNLRDQTFTLRRGPIFANVVLADEINRAPAKTQSALLEAMQESQVTIEGETHRLTAPFIVLATQNPVEQEGVYVLPEAQVDRFLFRILLGYPSLDEERQVLTTYHATPAVLTPVLSPDLIAGASEAAERTHVTPKLVDWIVRLVRATRAHPSVRLGASPRASLALLRTAKARAWLLGRDMVLPDDIKALAAPVLNHRIILSAEADLDDVRVGDVIASCLASTPWDEARP